MKKYISILLITLVSLTVKAELIPAYGYHAPDCNRSDGQSDGGACNRVTLADGTVLTTHYEFGSNTPLIPTVTLPTPPQPCAVTILVNINNVKIDEDTNILYVDRLYMNGGITERSYYQLTAGTLPGTGLYRMLGTYDLLPQTETNYKNCTVTYEEDDNVAEIDPKTNIFYVKRIWMNGSTSHDMYFQLIDTGHGTGEFKQVVKQ
jgi:hypothetical protein